MYCEVRNSMIGVVVVWSRNWVIARESNESNSQAKTTPGRGPMKITGEQQNAQRNNRYTYFTILSTWNRPTNKKKEVRCPLWLLLKRSETLVVGNCCFTFWLYWRTISLFLVVFFHVSPSSAATLFSFLFFLAASLTILTVRIYVGFYCNL